MNHHITYHKWNTKENKIFKKSCKDHLNIKDFQIYNPIFSLYFHIHNTKNARQLIDLNRRYILKEITESNDYKYYNSNKLLKGKVYDSYLKESKEIDLFCKCMSILDPIHIMMNNYKLKNDLLPNNYIHNFQNKINNLNNSVYIDTFFSYITSELVIEKNLPSFPLFYGSINGILEEYKLDISDEYHEFITEKWFHKNIGDIFTIDLFVSETDSESNSESNSDSSVSLYEDDDFICKFKDIPVQYLFIERLEGTLEDFLQENINYNLIISSLFQIIFALAYLQKHYQFTHNDLHINNVMYEKTETIYLYYKYNNIYFRIPTFGYIFKIIDFGRSIFTFKNKVFFNDSFSKYGEAEGQYHYPIPNVMLFKKNKYEIDIQPNYSFDMCRLSTTILDEIDNGNLELYQFLTNIVIDKDGNNIFETMTDSFDLYVDIAKNACNGIPHELIYDDLFQKYRIKKKLFPKRDYYCMD